MKKACFYLSLIIAFFMSCVKAEAKITDIVIVDTITIKFGQYYINNGEANLPVMEVYDLKNQVSLSSLNNKKDYLIEVKSGPFDRYEATAEVLTSNGKVKKLKGSNQFLLTASKKNNGEMLELKVTHDLKGDVVYLNMREWTDKDKVNYKEKVEKYTT